MGWSHRRLALSEYALMAASAGGALLAREAQGWGAAVVLAALAAVYLVIARAIDTRWREAAKA